MAFEGRRRADVSAATVSVSLPRRLASKTAGVRLEAWLRRGDRFWLGAHLLVLLVTAWTSLTYFHPDEHYQVLEFLGLKLGFTQPAELPWEFAARLRPWFQPALYYAVLAPLLGAGLQDRFLMAFVLRLFSGLLSFCGLVALLRASEAWFSRVQARRVRLRWLSLAGFGPYLAVRTSSENLGAAFFLLGFALFVGGRDPECRDGMTRAVSFRRALGSGLLLGAAFECRFQVGFSVLGLAAWAALIDRQPVRRLAAALLGFALCVALGALLDRWGYGAFTFPPWTYLKVNLIEGVAARDFGSKWMGAYLHITLANLFAPLVILVIVGLTVCWLRRWRHALTWVTFPFVLGHSLIGHKEERFLFPILTLGLVAAALGLQEEGVQDRTVLARWGARAAAWFRRFQTTRLYRFAAAWNLACIFFLTVYPLGWRPHEQFAEWVYRNHQGIVHFAAEDPEIFPSYPFFRAGPPWTLHTISQGARIDAIETHGAPLYYLRREPFTAFHATRLGVASTFAFTEFPCAGNGWLREHVWPLLGRTRERLIEHGYQPKRSTWITAYPVIRR